MRVPLAGCMGANWRSVADILWSTEVLRAVSRTLGIASKGAGNFENRGNQLVYLLKIGAVKRGTHSATLLEYSSCSVYLRRALPIFS